MSDNSNRRLIRSEQSRIDAVEAFGSKGLMTPRTAIVAVAARRLNRPVRCVVNRMQGFTTDCF